MNAAQRRLTAALPSIIVALHDYVRDEQQKGNFSDMTGNSVNSFGVACYRDGHCFAVANMGSQEGGPIRTTLIEGDWFKKGEERYDNSVQQRTFEIDGEKYRGAADQVFYNEEVLAWLGRTWTRTKGFSFRVISVTEYHKAEARSALLRLSDEIERRGGSIWQFNLG
jgi:hypothetical protein